MLKWGMNACWLKTWASRAGEVVQLLFQKTSFKSKLQYGGSQPSAILSRGDPTTSLGLPMDKIHASKICIHTKQNK